VNVVGEPIETYCEEGQWRNSVDRGGPLLGEYRTREAAVEAGRDEARIRGVQHVIRGNDGAVTERNRYPRRAEEIPG
jgi:hypothetical protein